MLMPNWKRWILLLSVCFWIVSKCARLFRGDGLTELISSTFNMHVRILILRSSARTCLFGFVEERTLSGEMRENPTTKLSGDDPYRMYVYSLKVFHLVNLGSTILRRANYWIGRPIGAGVWSIQGRVKLLSTHLRAVSCSTVYAG